MGHAHYSQLNEHAIGSRRIKAKQSTSAEVSVVKSLIRLHGYYLHISFSHMPSDVYIFTVTENMHVQ